MSKEKLEFVEPVDTNTDNEYSREPVPLEARKSCFSLTIVWTGFVFLVTSMMAGGWISCGTDFQRITISHDPREYFLMYHRRPSECNRL